MICRISCPQSRPPACRHDPHSVRPLFRDCLGVCRFLYMHTTLSTGGSQHLSVVLKRLRSFDEHDAVFFLELLPAPRCLDDLPESIRFRNMIIDDIDSDYTFSVVLIYLPSGCGKSSLLRPGLLPRLSPHVVALYVGPRPRRHIACAVKALRKPCPGFPPSLSLQDSLTSL